ncbi:MAG TPA: LuxR C-terminal-related transcriptional regulator [Streptosporangiaceae bacterium]|nr:LuxR C-terminal-related transcriptional regulator [Streptosporangiaceae bacterium]
MTTADPAALPGPRMAGPAIIARPGLWQQLNLSTRVTVVSAPAGSGKTVLLTSWIDQANLADSAAFVQVMRDERDPQRFWLSVLSALRQTSAGSVLVRPVTAAPDMDGWAITERLLTDLAALGERLWLVIDDLHELHSDQARRQLELLMLRAPQELRFVLATRHDVRLGLHRLRLEGDLTEIRAEDLRFTVAEARELLSGAGAQLADPVVELLVDRTEGWVAGLRLAALSLVGHPDPARFAAEFSGSQRTVAEYLLAEVLDRQPEEVRRMLLRTSILERVNGELADLLSQGSGAERLLQDLEEANAFVLSLDASRTWFRYHHLFAGLLQLELRRTEPGAVAGLHELASRWLAEHGFPVEATRHAQAAQDWKLAAAVVADHWSGLYLSGQTATVHALLAGFPAGLRAADAELAAVAALDELAHGSIDRAKRSLKVAEGQAATVPPDRRRHAEVLVAVARMFIAGRSGDQRARAEDAWRLLSVANAQLGGQPGLGEELQARALLEIGDAETWTGRTGQAEIHLEQAIALSRRSELPYLEFMGLTYRAEIELNRRIPRAQELSKQAMALAGQHGWTDDLFAGFASMTLGSALTWQGQLDEAEDWVQRAERVFRAEANPASAMGGYYVRGHLELARGRFADALAAFRAAERLAGPHPLARPLQAWLVYVLVGLGETAHVADGLAALPGRVRERGEIRIAEAVLRLAQEDPRAATMALAPVLAGSARVGWRSWLAEAFLLEAIARDMLGDNDPASRALELAFDIAEPDGALMWFLLHPAPDLLERQAGRHTAHGPLIAKILSLLTGNEPVPRDRPRLLLEPLSRSELRVLRYLPTHLSAPEIAGELSVSTSTVKTHMRNLYAKLGAHRRAEAIERARAMGLLAPSAGPR